MFHLLRQSYKVNLFLILCMILESIQAQNLRFDNWQVKHGLPQNSINHLLQTKDGYIWLATGGGLVRFDGVKFDIFNISNTKSLKSNRIRMLYETQKGDLLIYSIEAGISVYKNQEFIDLPTKNEFDAYKFNLIDEKFKLKDRHKMGEVHITEDEFGRIYLFCNGIGATVLDASTYTKLKGFEFIDNPDYHYLCTVASQIYVTKNDSIFLIDRRLKYIGKHNEEVFYCQFSTKLKTENWSLKNNKILEYQNGKLVNKYIIPGDIAENEYALKIEKLNNDFYLSNTNGSHTIRFNTESKTFTIYKNEFTIDKGNLNQIYADREGNLWYASSTGGLFKVIPQRFEYIDEDADIPSRNFYPVVMDDNKNIILGTQANGYYIFDTLGNYIPISKALKIELGNFYCYDLEFYDGAIYIPIQAKDAIVKIKDNIIKVIPFRHLDGFSTKIYKTKQNKLILGGFRKIYLLSEDILTDHPVNKEIEFDHISSFFEDSKNNLWVICYGGIYVFSPNHKLIKTYKKDDQNNVYFRSAFEDNEGRIFIGSYGNGLTIIENQKIFSIDIKNGLFENVISTITEDSRGFLWFTGNIGLTRVSKKEVLDLINGKRKTLNPTLFNEETDLLRTSEFNGGNQHPKLHLKDDIYLFPTINGCVKVNLAEFKLNNVIPSVIIEEVKCDEKSYKYNPIIEIPYTEQRVEIYFTALSFVAPQNVKFRYRLDGYDKQWIEGGKDRKTFYSKIPPGKYTFRVIACNNDGIWNETGASIQLSIIPPMHMTIWFQSALAVTGIILLIIIILTIQRRSRKREQEKSAMMDILPDLLLKIDRNGRYIEIYGNPAALIMPFENLKGKYIHDILPKELTEIIMQKLNIAFRQKSMQVFDYQLKLPDGILHYFEGKIIAKDNYEALFIISDITEKTEAQQKLIENEKKLLAASMKEKRLLETINKQQKQQLATIIDTEEKERKRIAKDLHDGIGQMLSSVKINLDVAVDRLKKHEKNQAHNVLITSKQYLEQITNEIRNISYNLSPPSLDFFGLSVAIEEEIKKINARDEIEIHFFSNNKTLRLNPKIEIVLFRAFQELLNNALKHSNATEITVQMIEYEKNIVLMIEDNGKGFNVKDAIAKKDSSGLKNIITRIESVKGKIHFDSSSNAGTSITVEVSNENIGKTITSN